MGLSLRRVARRPGLVGRPGGHGKREACLPCDNLDNLVNAIVVKNLTGEITQAGDTNLHKIRLDPYKSYLIEAIGVDGRDMLGVEEHPNLTLEGP